VTIRTLLTKSLGEIIKIEIFEVKFKMKDTIL